MCWEDFYNNFNKLYICKIFPPTWQQFSITDSWEGNTAGGPLEPRVRSDEDSKKGNIQPQSNDKWFNNPQFRLSVKKKTQIYISLMQEDEKISKRQYIPVNFLVVRTKSRRDRLWEIWKEDIVMEAATDDRSSLSERSARRSLSILPMIRSLVTILSSPIPSLTRRKKRKGTSSFESSLQSQSSWSNSHPPLRFKRQASGTIRQLEASELTSRDRRTSIGAPTLSTSSI